jgi:hemerythrin-like metal-binding protein
MLIEWREAWLTGEERIDAEHLDLVARINALYAAIGAGEGREAVAAALTAILERTRAHFAYEESLMAATAYPEAALHHERHQTLYGMIKLVAETVAMVKTEVALGTVDFLEGWFIGHVESDDAALGRYLAARPGLDGAISSEPSTPD